MSSILFGKRLVALYLVVPVMLLLSIIGSKSYAAASLPELTLESAAQRVLAQHPQLQVFDWRLNAAATQLQVAELKPGYQLALGADNLLGTGELSGVKRLELSVAISSVLELGNKRQARAATASAEQALLLAKRQASSLDLLGELTQRFISVLTLQQKQQLAGEAVAISEQALQWVSQRVQSGAAPEAELLRAQVAVRQAQLQQGLLQAELASSKLALASLWGAQHADFSTVSGDLLQLADSPDFQLLYQRLLTTPQLEVFAATTRLQQAQLTQLHSQSVADVNWQLGIMRSQENRDFALVTGVSVPLFTAARNQGAVKIALAEHNAAQLTQQYELLQLRARLYQAWQTHRYSVMAVRDLQRDILPLLQQALTQTEAAYLRGRYSYTDWLSARQALQDAKLQLLDAASTALSNQALLEQLSGLPLAGGVNHQFHLSQPLSSAATSAAGSLP